MKLVVIAGDEEWIALQKACPAAEWKRVPGCDEFLTEHADAFFNLDEGSGCMDYHDIKAPVFINSICTALSEMNAPENVIRLNAWPGFIEKDTWEISGKTDAAAESVLNKLQKKYIMVTDEPGMVSPRIIAMIINEAFYAKGENVSSADEIDIAMKLGTNYPYGPFEWAQKIGLQHVYALLEKLSAVDDRYTPAPALQKEIITY